MPEARVTLTFVVDDNKLSEFVTKMRDTAEQLADEWRCPAVEHVQDMRCELERDHIANGGPKRHHNGTLSWPDPADVKVGHFSHPASCREISSHHHWRDPSGRDWIMAGPKLATCEDEHLTEWNKR